MSKVIIGTGSDLPEQVITNDDIAAASRDWDAERAGTSLHEWTMARTGVAIRHRISEGEGTSDMATRAAQRALESAGLEPEAIELIVLSTVTSDYRLPQTVNIVQQRLGTSAKCIQVETGCNGFVDGVITASALMDAVGYRTALVICTEALSTIVDPELFMFQTIFGDGAGAVVLRDEPGSPFGIRAFLTATDGTKCMWTFAPGGGTKAPITHDVLDARSQYLQLDYKNVFTFAVEKIVESTYEVLARADSSIEEVDWIIPHQTGRNIIEVAAEQLKVPFERFIMCIDHTGNTSGATIPIALDEANRAGLLEEGHRIVLPAVGAGMAWGALYVVWRSSGGS
jgi:3-oxoacyl-[acyl-carrier-protein] synthase-3